MVPDTVMQTSMVHLHTRPVCYLTLFRCMLVLIFVKHKSKMTIPSQTVWTPPWYATIFNLLCVDAVPVFLKILWWCINNSPESSTWAQVLYLYPLLIHVVLLSIAHIWGLGLSHFSALVCEVAVKNGGVPGYQLESRYTQVWCREEFAWKSF